MLSNKKIQITDAGGTNLLPHTSLDNIQVSKTDNTAITLATEIGLTGSTAALPTEYAVREALNQKQDTLTEGSNVSLQGNTVSVPDASTSEKGAVQIDTAASNGVSLEVNGGTVKVNAEKASSDGFGTVKVDTSDSNGVSLEVNGGTVKVNAEKASTDAFGTVKVDTAASNGVSLEVNGGTVKVNAEKASSDGFGTVKVDTSDSNGVSLEVNGGTVKVNAEKASTDAFGTVKVDTAASNGVSLEVNSGTVKVNASIATNTTSGIIAGATNGVKLVDGIVHADLGDGLLCEGNKITIDDASVGEVLVGVENGTASIDDKVVTPGNLKGALSVGQAVDVSCSPSMSGGTPAYEFSSDNSTWDTVTNFKKTNAFLNTFSVRAVNMTPDEAGHFWGWYSGTGATFPKFADGLKYLIIADICNTGATAADCRFSCNITGGIKTVAGLPQGLTGTQLNASQTSYTRIACTITVDRCYIVFKPAAANTTIQLAIKNWRQYEVTALTDEAIAYLASLSNPDDFFRSNSAYTVLGKYLVKQDTVAPWIPTISMPDNSDLTVAAGLSYRIKYTNDNTHKITVDTIPANAYGWDTHIQMFIKGTSAIQFQPPLILMDALTPNAGHNLIIKYRNGDALVYVDDTNAGNIVVSATGTTAGTLNYFIQQNPGSGNDNYVIFATATDGLTCDGGTVSVAYTTNILGNGTDKTTVTGAFDVAAATSLSLQDLTLTGSTVSGSSTGKVYLYGTSLTDLTVTGTTAYCLDNVIIPAGATVHAENTTGKFFPNSVILNGDLYMKGTTVETGTTITGTGTLHMNDGAFEITNRQNITLKGITLTDTVSIYSWKNTSIITLENVTVISTAHSSNPYCLNISGDASVAYVKDSVLDIGSDAAAQVSGVYTAGKGTIYLSGTTFAGGYLAGGMLVLSNFNKLASNLTYNASGPKAIIGNTPDVSSVIFVSGSTMDLSLYTRTNAKAIYNCTITIQDNVQILLKNSKTLYIDACIATALDSDGYVAAATGKDIVITGTTLTTWKATNAILASPLDAHEASTVQLVGTTFTSGSLISREPMRIQLPAGSTNSFAGNTNAADTKILQAPIVIVGDDPSQGPNGSATVVNAAGTTSTISGLGTYIDKEGDNDFRPVASNFVVSNTNSSGAGSLLDRLTSASAQAASTSMAQFVTFASGGTTGVASMGADTTVSNTNIIDKSYNLLLGGTYVVSSGGVMTVDQSMKTATIAGAQMTLVDAVVPSGATVNVSGGGLAVEKATGNGGVIAGNAIVNGGSATLTGLVLTGGTVTSGGLVVISGGTAILSDCVLSGNSTSGTDYAGTLVVSRGAVTMNNCSAYDNSSQIPIYVRSGSLTIRGGSCETAIHAYEDAIIGIGNTVRINSITSGTATKKGSVTISSGAIIDLTGRINPGNGITVLDGGCTVNGTSFGSAGGSTTYTSIVSSGGSAVAE